MHPGWTIRSSKTRTCTCRPRSSSSCISATWTGQGTGPARHPEYRVAVARADAAIGRIARTIDPRREALVVTSDHGHLDEGGHGGTEPAVVAIPVVVWGAGAVRRTHAGRGRDVGPTIASLLGIGPL